jgi:hypothetical protein
MFIFSYGVAAF